MIRFRSLALMSALVYSCATLAAEEPMPRPHSRLEVATESLARRIESLAQEIEKEQPKLAARLRTTVNHTRGLRESQRATRMARLFGELEINNVVAKHEEARRILQTDSLELLLLHSQTILDRQKQQREAINNCLARSEQSEIEFQALIRLDGKDQADLQPARLMLAAERRRTTAALARCVVLELDAIVVEIVDGQVEYAKDVPQRLRERVIEPLELTAARAEKLAAQLDAAAEAKDRAETFAALRKEQKEVTAKLRTAYLELEKMEGYQEAIKLLIELGTRETIQIETMTEQERQERIKKILEGNKKNESH